MAASGTEFVPTYRPDGIVIPQRCSTLAFFWSCNGSALRLVATVIWHSMLTPSLPHFSLRKHKLCPCDFGSWKWLPLRKPRTPSGRVSSLPTLGNPRLGIWRLGAHFRVAVSIPQGYVRTTSGCVSTQSRMEFSPSIVLGLLSASGG